MPRCARCFNAIREANRQNPGNNQRRPYQQRNNGNYNNNPRYNLNRDFPPMSARSNPNQIAAVKSQAVLRSLAESRKKALADRPTTMAEIKDLLLKGLVVAQINFVDTIHEVESEKREYDGSRYRIAVLVRNAEREIPTLGMIDTGANVDCLTLQYCKQLGIEKNIVPCAAGAANVSGDDIPLAGRIYTKIMIGEVPYQAMFQVHETIDRYDVIVGTTFLIQVRAMPKIMEAIENVVGAENTRRDF